ncbi:hypothetical protein [Rhizosphaericola mali]|uniref:Carboxypeptidase-like regulatory domain-containing protein n=1 Tax=Rhizosphaericola mali TaxID=2545455 RepID=A0A5P2GAL2_9BACT|nr:hypothetical protein [Rhizosphaericola mali]QES90740.1 hypothetical protein E0W69_019470 [Rhizosphaericola mali]
MKRYIYLLFIGLFFSFSHIYAQQKILKGKISAGMTTESTEGIMLETTSGDMTFSDASGNFSVSYKPNDTLKFYIAGKYRSQYPIDSLAKIPNLMMSLQSVRNTPLNTGKITYFPTNDDTTTLNNVTVRTRNYHADSLNNRKEYGDAYNYTKPKVKSAFDVLNVGKMEEVLNFKKKKQHQMLKDNLQREEQEGYIDNRFTRTFVRKYLGQSISDEKLEDFMRKYRPKYEEIVGMSDLELIDYIRISYTQYQKKG